jgi:hypothetical protein
MKRTELDNYVVFKFYIPDYYIQSRPIPIRASLVKKKGLPWALNKAKDTFLIYGLKPIGEVTPKQESLWEDGMITYDTRVKKLSAKQIEAMKYTKVEKKKVGWKRLSRSSRYGRRRG